MRFVLLRCSQLAFNPPLEIGCSTPIEKSPRRQFRATNTRSPVYRAARSSHPHFIRRSSVTLLQWDGRAPDPGVSHIRSSHLHAFATGVRRHSSPLDNSLLCSEFAGFSYDSSVCAAGEHPFAPAVWWAVAILQAPKLPSSLSTGCSLPGVLTGLPPECSKGGRECRAMSEWEGRFITNLIECESNKY